MIIYICQKIPRILEADQAVVWFKPGIGLEKKVSNERDLHTFHDTKWRCSFSTRLKNITIFVEPLPLKI